ncbi:hypothetical protein G4O51_03575 [Candidatus Bathyarchaeota archaeon A05DMB-2]|nr:hypothetical protein [Candidatus Bathyarchaeota archaeon A05DMB-2]
MKNLEIEEHPGQTTAGLTSASQIINTTDATSFDPANTSSDVPEPVLLIPELLQPSEFGSSKETFREALRRSMRRKAKILEALAKY